MTFKNLKELASEGEATVKPNFKLMEYSIQIERGVE
jgi:hypothetical protein